MRIDPGRLSLPLMVTAVAAVVGVGMPQRAPQAGTLEARVAALEESQQRLASRLDQLGVDLNNTLEPLRVRLADYGEDMRSMEARLVALEEQLTLTNQGIARLAEQISGLGDAPRSQASVGTPMPPPQRPAGVPPPSVARRPEPRLEPSESDNLYSDAYTQYLEGNYTLAISGFREFLRRFPQSQQADNALFWIGESMYAQEDYGSARATFLQIRRQYPEAEILPDALFKAAQCLLDSGAPDEAVVEFARLIRDFPATDSARIACAHLENLGAEKPPECGGL